MARTCEAVLHGSLDRFAAVLVDTLSDSEIDLGENTFIQGDGNLGVSHVCINPARSQATTLGSSH